MASVVVIDDDERIRRFLQRLLEHAGHRVVTAGNGDEGIELYRRERADLVITDILMPVKDGISTIHELRRAFPEVKIIAMSGGGTYSTPGHYLELAGKMGAQRTLTKPFDAKALLESVGELLTDQRPVAEGPSYS
jgi:DNA-binding response OmpR family regulator